MLVCVFWESLKFSCGCETTIGAVMGHSNDFLGLKFNLKLP